MAANQENERVTRWFLGLVGFGALLNAGFGLSPSSYGSVFLHLGADDAGPIAGAPRDIRSDEWAVLTPQFQIAVRNGFRRINDSSFYHEDLRNYEPLPLKDWSLVFKPQFWAFFILPPARAFSIYFAFFMAAFLAGLYLLFRELGAPAAVSIAAALAVYFSGFSQFWWTTFLPVLALYPWVLLVTLRPMVFWKKALIAAWLFPGFLFSHAYPPLLLTHGVVRGLPDSGVSSRAAAITGRTRRDRSRRCRRRDRVLHLHGPYHRNHEQCGSPGPPRGPVENHAHRGGHLADLSVFFLPAPRL